MTREMLIFWLFMVFLIFSIPAQKAASNIIRPMHHGSNLEYMHALSTSWPADPFCPSPLIYCFALIEPAAHLPIPLHPYLAMYARETG